MDTEISTIEETTNTTNNSNSNIAIFFIAAILIIVLISIVILQNRKIKDLKRPKYGFLGKPLGLIAFAALIGAGSITLYVGQNSDSTDIVEINANSEFSIKIDSKLIDKNTNLYILSATPLVEDIEWGGDQNFKLDISWVIENTRVSTEFEYEISPSNPSNLEINLKPGTNKIKAILFINGKKVEEEIVITI
ncbi:MAG: hypothetical protein Q9M91_04820 [Candidatus Dojkabacteria bacterium]|nr:hypothetical protein [Candidatus Dojkabacteria bacterium]MDQ7021131.1 hypothetical protein [Candidatus Dojkabacteria bacterium]